MRAYGFALVLAMTGFAGAGELPRKPNVVLFLMDTVRSDHASCYGYGRRTTPALDELASAGTVFENAFAQGTWSLVSYSSFFASLYPTEHGVSRNGHALAQRWFTFPEILQGYGYQTAAFAGGGHLVSAFAFDQGFRLFNSKRTITSISVSVTEAMEWLESSQRRSPFLLLVHGYDAHMPYQSPHCFAEMHDPDYRGIVHAPGFLRENFLATIAGNRCDPCQLDPIGERPDAPAGAAAHELEDEGPLAGRLPGLNMPLRIPKPLVELSEADRAHVVAHYDGAVSWADFALARLLDSLEHSNLLDSTIVVVASDHGERLFEHGDLGHAGWPYRQVIQVPLVFSGPGIARGRRVRDAVELIDVAPTLLELTGAEPCVEYRGSSLAPYLSATSPAPTVPDSAAFSSNMRHFSIWTAGWHLLMQSDRGRTGATWLFRTSDDSGETEDMAAAYPDVARRLSDRLLDWLEQHDTAGEADPSKLGRAAERMLRRFGYW